VNIISKISRESGVFSYKLLVSVSGAKEESLGGRRQWIGLCCQGTRAHAGVNHWLEYRLQYSHPTALQCCLGRRKEGEQ